MPEIIENFLNDKISYDDIDKLIQKANLWQTLCIKEYTYQN
jgi:hypothetical protein